MEDILSVGIPIKTSTTVKKNENHPLPNSVKDLIKDTASVYISTKLNNIDKFPEGRKTGLSADLYNDLLDKIYQEKLKFIPKYNNNIIIINTQMRLICNLCKCKLPTSYEIKNIIQNLNIHVDGVKHRNNLNGLRKNSDNFISRKLSLSSSSSSLDDGVVAIPDRVMSDIFLFGNNQRNLFSGYILLFTNCKICDKNLNSCNRMNVIQNLIYVHVSGIKHCCKFYATLFIINSFDAINSSIDYLHNEIKTLLPKKLYQDLLNNIYEEKLKKLPPSNEKLITIDIAKIYAVCNICNNRFAYTTFNQCKDDLLLHINSKKHKKIIKDKTYIKEGNLKPALPKNVFTITDVDNFKIVDSTVEQNKLFTVYLHVIAKCKLCSDLKIVSSANISDVRNSIHHHMFSKNHILKYVKEICNK
ncbi:uncharacterized protein LOC142332237 [Lycorma delicatula]|uniref:uncharacterized protein LOC142332237 n=1 Tax=Lycorma delicatula TaxID=130591 RepID=UPI003F51A7CE